MTLLGRTRQALVLKKKLEVSRRSWRWGAFAITTRIFLLGVTVKETKVGASRLTSVLLWHSVVQFP